MELDLTASDGDCQAVDKVEAGVGEHPGRASRAGRSLGLSGAAGSESRCTRGGWMEGLPSEVPTFCVSASLARRERSAPFCGSGG